MSRTSASLRRCAIVAALASAVATVPTVAAQAATSTTPNRIDIAFVEGNAQTNFAEITIGKIALARSSNPAVRMLAMKTMSDHRAAEATLEHVATAVGITRLARRADAAQRKLAAKLAAIPAAKFDLAYLTAQVSGHKASIKATRGDLLHGRSAPVAKYAAYYLPVAVSHLRMSQQDLHKLPHTG